MSLIYSQKLIEETIKCFKEEDNLDISIETAIEYLDSLGGLFLAFAGRGTSAGPLWVAEVPSNLISLKVGSVLPKPEAGPRGPDLISPHSCNN